MFPLSKWPTAGRGQVRWHSLGASANRGQIGIWRAAVKSAGRSQEARQPLDFAANLGIVKTDRAVCGLVV